MNTRTVAWGEALAIKLRRHPGGLKGVTDRLRHIWGPVADSRVTLAKLQAATNPDEFDDLDRWRAYQVLAAIGENPEEWDIRRADLTVRPKMVEELHAALSEPYPPDPALGRETCRLTAGRSAIELRGITASVGRTSERPRTTRGERRTPSSMAA